MEEKLEQKIDALTKSIGELKGLPERINGLDEGTAKLADMMAGLKNSIDLLARNTAREFERMDERFDDMVTSKELQELKLDMLDRFATLDKVNDHELRLQRIEARS